jgi:hypothetical protein
MCGCYSFITAIDVSLTIRLVRSYGLKCIQLLQTWKDVIRLSTKRLAPPEHLPGLRVFLLRLFLRFFAFGSSGRLFDAIRRRNLLRFILKFDLVGIRRLLLLTLTRRTTNAPIAGFLLVLTTTSVHEPQSSVTAGRFTVYV